EHDVGGPAQARAAGRGPGPTQDVEHRAGGPHVEVRLGLGLDRPAAGRRVSAALPWTGPGDLGGEQALAQTFGRLTWTVAGREPEPGKLRERTTGEALGD